MDLSALYKISYGLYVVSSKKGEKLNGQIANTVFQLTAEPLAVGVSINKNNFTYDCLKESQVFSVSILAIDTPMELIGLFGFKSGREVEKFTSVNFKIGKIGAPVLEDHTVAYLEAQIRKEIDLGTHTLFVGEIVEAENLEDKEPLTYAYYHLVKKGFTPKASPLYQKSAREKDSGKYVCTVCGYVYDPKTGDPVSGVKPGTAFEDLPESWVCPVCGARKNQFKKIL